MCINSQLFFPLEKSLNLPPLSKSYLKCILANKERDVNEFKINVVENITFPFAETPLMEVPVSSSSVLCEGDNIKTVVELMLDVSGLNLKYLPGDTIGILPKNNEKEVEEIINSLGLNCNDIYKIDSEGTKIKNLSGYIPALFTVKYLLESCLDLRSVVKKIFLRELIEHTSDPTEKRRLVELCSREGATEYNEYILKPKSSIMDVLKVFPSCKPPLSSLIENIPRLLPRPYSIASSPLKELNKIRIVFNIVIDSRKRRGICSGWLYDVTHPLHDLRSQFSHMDLTYKLKPNSIRVPVYLRKPNNFRIPQCPSVSLIMIGTGTGVSPFIGFMEHRKQQLLNEENKPENWIIFGCRHRNKDDIFRSLFLTMEEERLCSYYVSYSRDKNNIHPKYVQDTMRLKEKDLVDKLLMSNAVLFICGNGLTMTNNVIETIVQLIVTVKDVSEEEASNIVKELEKKGQIIKELWG